MEATKTLEQFISENGISMKAKRSDKMNPNMPNPDMRHWRCTLKREGASMSLWFSQGSAHKEEPTAAEVLNCLASDSSGADDHSFDDWCAEYGYETDSRAAYKTYQVCRKQAAKLQDFLGTDAYGELLYSTESL